MTGGRFAVATGSAIGLGVGLIATAVAAATLPLGSSRSDLLGPSSLLAVSVKAAAALLVASGILALAVDGPRAAGWLALAAALAWLAPVWLGWRPGPAVVHAVAGLVAPLLLPVLVHLAAAYPTGLVRGRRAGRVMLGGYGVAVAIALGIAATYDPFYDPDCLGDCPDNPLLVSTHPDLARSLATVERWCWVLVGTGLALWCLGRLAGFSPVARRSLGPVLAPLALAGLAEAGWAAVLLRDRLPGTQARGYEVASGGRAVALSLTACGVAWFALTSYRRDRAVTRLAESLDGSPAPGALQASLAESLGDQDVRVAYVLPGTGRCVDSRGRDAVPDPGPGQVATTVARGGQPIAVVVHDATAALSPELGAAARLAVDNERKRAEVLAQLADLQASRARVLAVSSATRRQIERDLHDGAQQYLLALTFQLQRAAAAARVERRPELAEELESLQGPARTAMVELRDLARGIFPAILTEAGLTPALHSLAVRAPTPLEVTGTVERRLPAQVEMTAYRVVDAWIGAVAGGPDRPSALVDVADRGDRLVVQLRATGAGAGGWRAPAPPLDVYDWVGAVGGFLVVEDDVVRTELPCAL